MLTVSEARARLLAALVPLPAETVPLRHAAGRVLAADIHAPFDLPAFPNASMDGFAVRAADTAAAPVRLAVTADIPAGIVPAGRLQPGQAARIMTGAHMPDGADAVVPAEQTDFHSRDPGSAAPPFVNILAPAAPGDNVRARAADVTLGDLLIPRGARLRAQHLGMAAMLGIGALQVTRQPRVALLSTGDELLPPGSSPAPGHIFESNSLTLGTLVEEAGGLVSQLGIAADRADSVESLLDRAVAERADLIVSSAGVSVGAFDFVKSVVEAHGSLDFWRVNMRPGKPLAFGLYRGVPFVGLPGNPVSAFVGFEVFLRYALARLLAMAQPARPAVRARLVEPVKSDGRESYLRGVCAWEPDGVTVQLTGHQGSGNQFSLVQANSLVIIPASVRELAAGDEVEIWLL
jgi:molybdopterin molybdotransferase